MVSYFGKRHERDVTNAIAALLRAGLIHQDGLRYCAINNMVLYKSADDGVSHLDFLVTNLEATARDIPTWFDQPDIAHFQSSILSVRRQDLEELLPMIKSYLDLKRSRLESSDADMLVRFNVQIYPIGKQISDLP